MMTPIERAHRLVGELDSLYTGERAAAGLVALGLVAIAPLRRFLLEGKPRSIFQPRLWAVQALAGLKAKDVLSEYLFQARKIADPEDKFGEEAVESAAARFLAAWPDEGTYQVLLNLSKRRMLIGLIDALAKFKRPETIPYFERALEDDFYRPAAENAFLTLGRMSCDALSRSAVTPLPDPFMETPSSLERRRSAVRLLNRIGIAAEHWQVLRRLIHESDEELVVGACRLGTKVPSLEDRAAIAHRLVQLLSSSSWYLREDIEDSLVALKDEASDEIEDEIARRMHRPEDVRATDTRLRVLLRVRHRYGKA
jgi:HEAT repeat protein